MRLASLWGFDGLTDVAVGELGELVTDPVEKYEMGKAYGIKAWMDSGIVALAVRTNLVNASEAARIGYDVAYKLQACREAALQNTEGSTKATRLRTAISDTFGLDGIFVDKVADLDTALPAPVAGNLTGHWQETYTVNGFPGRRSSRMHVYIMIDENNHLRGKAGTHAIVGTVNGLDVSFKQTYQMYSETRRSVCNYMGKLTADGKTITGTWAKMTRSGTFMMKKV